MPQQACFISVEQKSNQFHSFNLLFVKKKVHLLNHVITSFFFFLRIWTHLRNSYICTVFFIVLDLRLTKDWLVWEDSLFYFILVSPPQKSVTAKNEKAKTKVRLLVKNIGNAKVCFSRIRKHVCTRIFPYSYTYVQTCADDVCIILCPK